MSGDVFWALHVEGAGGVTDPCPLVEVGVGESVFTAVRPFGAHAAHVGAVEAVVAGESDGPFDVQGSVVDLAPHVVGYLFPFVDGMPNP